MNCPDTSRDANAATPLGSGGRSGRILAVGRRRTAAANWGVRLRQAAVVAHQPALGAAREWPGRQDSPDAAKLFSAHAATKCHGRV